MKKLLFLLSSMLLLGVSCKKGSDDAPSGNYYISFKINGESRNFTEATGKITTGTTNFCNLKGSATSDATVNAIDLMFGTYSELKAGTYNSSSGAFASILYRDAEGDIFDLSQSVSITLEEVTNNHIKGTFTGIIKASGGVTLNFTEGAFDVARRQ